jgi:XRE family transcriptional regulator, aerobic/anaerobic benzoate catabolism transcriptional regulator
MSSTILHLSGLTPDLKNLALRTSKSVVNLDDEVLEDEKNPFLASLGERVRSLRSRRGMTRKAVALAAEVSERHLANLEYGVGNASILVLLQVAGALQCSLGELIGDITTSSPEWLLIRELLEQRDEASLVKCWVRVAPIRRSAQGWPWSGCGGRASPLWATCWQKTLAFLL